MRSVTLITKIIKIIKIRFSTMSNDNKFNNVSNPQHYIAKSGVEVIDLISDMPWIRGNAIKYIFRAGKKYPDKEIEDLEKAVFCINRELVRLRRENQIKVSTVDGNGTEAYDNVGKSNHNNRDVDRIADDNNSDCNLY